MSDRIGVSRQAVSRWESNSAKPDADKIIAICDLFGVSADYLLRDLTPSGISETNHHLQTQKQRRMNGTQIAGIVLTSQSLLFLFVFVLVGVSRGGTHDIIYGDGRIQRYQGFMAFVTVNHLRWLLFLLAAVGLTGIILLLLKPLGEKIKTFYNKL